MHPGWFVDVDRFVVYSSGRLGNDGLHTASVRLPVILGLPLVFQSVVIGKSGPQLSTPSFVILN